MTLPALRGDIDLRDMGDVPDPLAGIAQQPALPGRIELRSRPRTRSAVAASQAWSLGGALLYQAAWLVLLNKRDDLHTMAGHTLLLEVGIPVVAAAVGVGAAVAPGGRGLGEPKARLAALAILAPAFFVIATLVAAPADVDPESFWPHGLRCFVLTGVFTVGPLLLAARAFRGAFVVAPAWRSAALATGCAALAAVTTTFACSVGSAAHVIVGHGSMMLLAAAIGGLVGRRLGQA